MTVREKIVSVARNAYKSVDNRIERNKRKKIIDKALEPVIEKVYDDTHNKPARMQSNALNAIEIVKKELTRTDQMIFIIYPEDIVTACQNAADNLINNGVTLDSAVDEEVNKVLSKYNMSEEDNIQLVEKAEEAAAEEKAEEPASAAFWAASAAAKAEGGRRKRKSKKSKKSKRSRRGKKQIKKTKKYKKRSNKKRSNKK